MDGLFISYRRQESAYARRLYSDLASRYGTENVTFDIEDIAPGQDFAAALHAAVAASKSVLVVIGPQWLEATDASGGRRIDQPHDFIRNEVGQLFATKLDRHCSRASQSFPFLLAAP